MADSVPVLPRGVRRHFDTVRDVPVLLGPERVIMLDEIGCAILDTVDGRASLDTISEILATRYGAPKDAVLADVTEFLEGLANKKLVEVTDG
jgi:pyrroloquinoline quinone biosynthesis protein D